jgi:hypothetical protein
MIPACCSRNGLWGIYMEHEEKGGLPSFLGGPHRKGGLPSFLSIAYLDPSEPPRGGIGKGGLPSFLQGAFLGGRHPQAAMPRWRGLRARCGQPRHRPVPVTACLPRSRKRAATQRRPNTRSGLLAFLWGVALPANSPRKFVYRASSIGYCAVPAAATEGTSVNTTRQS